MSIIMWSSVLRTSNAYEPSQSFKLIQRMPTNQDLNAYIYIEESLRKS